MDIEEIKNVFAECEYELKRNSNNPIFINIHYKYGGNLLVDFSEIVNLKDENCLFIKDKSLYIDYSEIYNID